MINLNNARASDDDFITPWGCERTGLGPHPAAFTAQIAEKNCRNVHGALGAQEYQAMGFPCAAYAQYLARLGWSHGDGRILYRRTGRQDLVDLDGYRKKPAQFDLEKAGKNRGQHISAADDCCMRHGSRLI